MGSFRLLKSENWAWPQQFLVSQFFLFFLTSKSSWADYRSEHESGNGGSDMIQASSKPSLSSAKAVLSERDTNKQDG